jgi:hypothetical protein
MHRTREHAHYPQAAPPTRPPTLHTRVGAVSRRSTPAGGRCRQARVRAPRAQLQRRTHRCTGNRLGAHGLKGNTAGASEPDIEERAGRPWGESESEEQGRGGKGRRGNERHRRRNRGYSGVFPCTAYSTTRWREGLTVGAAGSSLRLYTTCHHCPDALRPRQITCSPLHPPTHAASITYRARSARAHRVHPACMRTRRLPALRSRLTVPCTPCAADAETATGRKKTKPPEASELVTGAKPPEASELVTGAWGLAGRGSAAPCSVGCCGFCCRLLRRHAGDANG